MCLSPITIINRTRNYNVGLDKVYLQVPCGECPQCLLSYQNSWRLRLENQLRSYKGQSFMCLLTYAPNKVPRFTIPCGSKNVTILGFSHEHIKKLRRDVFDYFHDKYNIPYGDIWYFCASEYGTSSIGTHRPHYHFTIGFKRSYKAINEKVIRFVFDKFWHKHYKLGLANPPKYAFSRWIFPRLEIDSITNSASYVSKYVCKDITFFSNEYLKSFIEEYKSLKLKYKLNFHEILTSPLSYEHKKLARYHYIYLRIKKYFPKHWQSNGFGINLLHYSTNSKPYPSVYPNPLKHDFSIPLPTYICDKITFTLDAYDRRHFKSSSIASKYYHNLFNSSLSRFHFFMSQHHAQDITPLNKINPFLFIAYVTLYRNRVYTTPMSIDIDKRINFLSNKSILDYESKITDTYSKSQLDNFEVDTYNLRYPIYEDAYILYNKVKCLESKTPIIHSKQESFKRLKNYVQKITSPS